jgi:hypothetical protein
MAAKKNPRVSQNETPCCCSSGKPSIGEKDFFGKGVSRRDFLLGLGAAGVGAWALSSSSAKAAPLSIGGEMTRIGSPLRVKPVLVYGLHQRREATSWRPWGGLHTQDDVTAEANRIEGELKKLASEADFPVEMLPVALARNAAEAAPIRDSDCDTILVYAASGWMDALETLAASKAHNIMFVRHKSGPVYLWYEIAHPHFLRKATDEYKQPRMDVWDVVVDKYSEVLWRLRALFGLKNAVGTKIIAIGDAGGWGVGHQLGPKTAREVWKLDIIPVTYKDLEPMIKAAMADEKAMQKAQKDTEEFLSRKGVSLHTDKKFVVNAFLLTDIFRDLMAKVDAPAITVNQCMGTIIPMSQTTACLPLNLINDEGLMAFCESDFVVVPSGILLRYISGKPSFMQDPTYPHDGVTTCAHCTGPSRMNGKDFEPTEIHTHFESDYGAAPKVNMKKGQVITSLIPDFASKKWVGFRGKIIDHPFYDICRCQIDVAMEGNWKKVLEDMRGFHWMICYGDYLREVGYALKKLGVGWENVNEV